MGIAICLIGPGGKIPDFRTPASSHLWVSIPEKAERRLDGNTRLGGALDGQGAAVTSVSLVTCRSQSSLQDSTSLRAHLK